MCCGKSNNSRRLPLPPNQDGHAHGGSRPEQPPEYPLFGRGAGWTGRGRPEEPIFRRILAPRTGVLTPKNTLLASEEPLFYEHEFRARLGKYSRAEKDFPKPRSVTLRWPSAARPSKGDGPSFTELGRASFEARLRRAPQDDGESQQPAAHKQKARQRCRASRNPQMTKGLTPLRPRRCPRPRPRFPPRRASARHGAGPWPARLRFPSPLRSR